MKYKIIKDDYLGYTVKVWRWWFPFWTDIVVDEMSANTYPTIERAKAEIERNKKDRYQMSLMRIFDKKETVYKNGG